MNDGHGSFSTTQTARGPVFKQFKSQDSPQIGLICASFATCRDTFCPEWSRWQAETGKQAKEALVCRHDEVMQLQTGKPRLSSQTSATMNTA
ncbi:unnamed protein product [Protopolystoma xenopodis]|uniref:Uncharacterized protein n=1 Tax=Protopolystoma xenopodis TaxID=117903 RepID=A0A3S5CN02_9PLAT|nr:unnamed protein product [Protopolystoma xenopodis]